MGQDGATSARRWAGKWICMAQKTVSFFFLNFLLEAQALKMHLLLFLSFCSYTAFAHLDSFSHFFSVIIKAVGKSTHHTLSIWSEWALTSPALSEVQGEQAKLH